MSKKLLNKSHFSKFIMGASMIGFLGFVSPNTVSAECWDHFDEPSCANAGCTWDPGHPAYCTHEKWEHRRMCEDITEKTACDAEKGKCHWMDAYHGGCM